MGRVIPNKYRRRGAGALRRTGKYRPRSQRVYKRERMNVKQRTTVPMGLGLPKKILVTHKYRQAFNHTSGAAGIFSATSFAANGMWDCDLIGAGHQPLYFDQISPLYDHYCVIGSRIKVTVINVSSTIPFRYGIFLNDDTTVVPTTMDALVEQATGKQIVVPVGGGFKHVLTSKWSAKKEFGGSILGNIELRGDSGSNPTEISTYTVAMESILSGAQSSAQVHVEIEYIAIWTELHDVNSS